MQTPSIEIHFAENLQFLKTVPSGSVDLIYIDPPFNTGRRQIRKRFHTESGAKVDEESYGYNDSCGDFIGFLRPRMEEAYRILKPHGSLFFHLDYREIHYCKIMLDEIFGRDSFINEIIWAYDYGARSRKKWSAKHDNILWYAKDPDDYTFNYDEMDRIPYMAPGLVGPVKAARGKTPTDVWWHTIVSPNSCEKTGYATQKPRGVIDRIVKVHSKPGDVLMDFFAGSGTLGESAYLLGRNSILVDNNKDAIAVMKRRFAACNANWIDCDSIEALAVNRKRPASNCICIETTMKYVSTRKGIEATAVESVFQGLAPDGGLYVPAKIEAADLPAFADLGEAERYVLAALFGDFPENVREEAIARLLSRFPESDATPIVAADGFDILELFHGRTGAFKDVALSMLPVFMRHAANGRRVLVLTATSGDTGSAAMQGFAGVDGTEVAVFFPNVGTSRIQRLQMTTPSDANVHAIAIRGNFDDAQAAVKRIFADPRINAKALEHNVYLSSANSINTGRLVPQIGYYMLAASRLGEFDVVVPSGNFGNILAAYYAKMLGAKIGKFVCASNVNDVLARFVKTGVYDPGEKFTITNSPSMDIRKSSNVERLLWLLNDGDGAEVERLMNDLADKGRYELNDKAKARLIADFEGGVATPEETEEEMRRMRSACGYVLDPHTAVATCVARKLGYPRAGRHAVIAATATPYKFPETCRHAFGEDVLVNPPSSFRDLETLPVAQTKVIDVDGIDEAVGDLFKGVI